MIDEQIPPEAEMEDAEPPSRSRLAIWLVALALAAMFVPVYLVSGSLEEATIPLEQQAEALAMTLTAPPVVPEEEQQLTDRLLAARGQLSSIQEIPVTLAAQHLDWPSITQALLNYDANSIRLTSFTHDSIVLTLIGSATAESEAIRYAEMLESSGLFLRVSVQSIVLNPPPTPTPAPTGQSGETSAVHELTMPFVFTLALEFDRTSNGLR